MPFAQYSRPLPPELVRQAEITADIARKESLDFYETIFEDPHNFFDRIFRFLGIPNNGYDFEKYQNERVNETKQRFDIPDDIRLILINKYKDMVSRVQTHIGYVPDNWRSDFQNLRR